MTEGMQLKKLAEDNGSALYQLTKPAAIKRFLVTTPETRAICNDPFVVGVRYTTFLKGGCAKALSLLAAHLPFELKEHKTTVLHILRGGLSFGLREALSDSFGWNDHHSAFVSAQRARRPDKVEEWFITEAEYQKIYLPPEGVVIFGDVVATGTSLEFALERLLASSLSQRTKISGLLFFTIGSERSEEIVGVLDQKLREVSPSYQGAAVVYFEGRFAVANERTPIEIKLTGTDLLRRDSLLTEQFITSQYEDPSYPIERCTIYDAGSRAFWLPEYYEDLADYWQQVLKFAEEGGTYQEFLQKRFPEIAAERYGAVDLEQLAQRQLARIETPHF